MDVMAIIGECEYPGPFRGFAWMYCAFIIIKKKSASKQALCQCGFQLQFECCLSIITDNSGQKITLAILSD